MDNKKLAGKLLKLAKEIMAADTFPCPTCGTKVLEQTKYCVKCKKKVDGGKKEEKKESSDNKEAMPMLVLPSRGYQIKPILSALKSAMGLKSNAEAVSVQYLTNMTGSSNKFHYFAVFETEDGDYVGGNAYGRIGYNPKAIEVARGSLREVEAKLGKKIRQKMNKDYNPDKHA